MLGLLTCVGMWEEGFCGKGLCRDVKSEYGTLACSASHCLKPPARERRTLPGQVRQGPLREPRRDNGPGRLPDKVVP